MVVRADIGALPCRPGLPAVDVRGRGRLVVLVHGVAFGPDTMVPTAQILSGRGLRVAVLHRRGYGRSAEMDQNDRIDLHVADLLNTITRLGGEAPVVAGVSGGATIAVAAAIAHPECLAAIVAHEPALGPLAEGVNEILSAAAAGLAATSDPAAGAVSMASTLAGPTSWLAIAEEQEDRVRATGATVVAEVPSFVAFAPSFLDLTRLESLPVVSSVGRSSSQARHEAANVLVNYAGAALAVLPCHHLAQIEAPDAFADTICTAIGASS